MISTWKLPELGDGISSATVMKVMIKVGDKVVSGQPVLEVETDKVTVEVPTNVTGTVKSVLIKEDDKVSEGMDIFTYEGA